MSEYKMVDDRKRWRAACEQIGADHVRHILTAQPARSLDEVVFDVVQVPPYPTRRFLQEWLVDRENTIFRLSTPMIMTIIAALGALLLIWFAYDAFIYQLPSAPISGPVSLGQQGSAPGQPP